MEAGGRPPDPWLWQSIVATLLCCLPAGAVGIYFAAKSQQAASSGDLGEATAHADKARQATLWAVGHVVLAADHNLVTVLLLPVLAVVWIRWLASRA